MDQQMTDQILRVADQYPTWGYQKIYHWMRHHQVLINHKRVLRLYREAKLSMRRKTRKRIPKRVKQPLLQPLCPNLSWSMDFMRDSLFHGKPFRSFNVIDDFNREALNITIAKSITSERVILELDNLIAWRGKPLQIRVDNGPEFIASALQLWADRKDRMIDLVFIEKGKPSQNGYVERFNRTFREDILDAHLFDNERLAQHYSNNWIWLYNNERPHDSLKNLTPTKFLLKYGKLHAHPRGQIEFPTFQQDKNNQFNL